jgi:lipoyl-dependent peroxiredoxin
MQTNDKVLYTGKTTTKGGREGLSRSSDGHLDIQLSPPGGKGKGTNPEQLFAAGWSACFMGAMRRAGSQLGIQLPVELAIDAEVDLCEGDSGFFLKARLNVYVPGVDAANARAVIDRAHTLCPYSKMTHGNIEVELNLV